MAELRGLAATVGWVDIVIPTWNRRELVLGLLESLQAQAVGFTAYVVDNGSTDGTAQAVTGRYPGTHVMALPVNLGFARAVNKGIAAGNGDIVVVLNNDVIVEPGFLAAIIGPFAAATVGAVAGILLTADGAAVDAAGIMIDGSLAGYSHLHGAGLEGLVDAKPAMAPCGGAAAYRRSALELVGGFDEEIFAYSEDVDLGLRLMASGVETVTAWNARVRHLGSATLGHRSTRQLELSAWSRGYVLGRYRVRLHLVLLELSIGLLDAVTVRHTAPLMRRLVGLRHGRRLASRVIPGARYLPVRAGLAPRWDAFRRNARNRPGRVGVENGVDRDLVSWRAEHVAGLRPDASPYGLDRLADHGIDVTILGSDLRPGRVVRAVCQVTLHLARIDPISVFRARKVDILVTEHEKHGMPALFLAPFRPRLKIITGVVWLTDVDVDVNPLLQRVLRKALGRASAIFVHSSAQLPVLRSWGIPSDKLFLAHMGVDVDFWTPRRLSIEEQVSRALIVSAGSDRDRDYPVLLDAMVMLRRERPDLRLEIAGVPALRAQEHVTYVGTLTHAELLQRYRRAAVVVVPTRPNVHCSGLTSALESMACGRPVVVNDNPGMSDYIADGVTGLMVTTGDPLDMARAINSLLDAPLEADLMGVRARAKAVDMFSTDASAATIADICRQVLKPSERFTHE